MKLSLAQQNAISKMREGYELGHYYGFTTSYSLQKGGCGRGGVSAKILGNTYTSLKNKKLIQKIPESNSFRLTRYELSELGKTVLLDLV
jgi:hypothetical protein